MATNEFDAGAILAGLESFYAGDAPAGGGADLVLDLDDQAAVLVKLWELSGHVKLLHDRCNGQRGTVQTAYSMACGAIGELLAMTAGSDDCVDRARAIVDALPFGAAKQAVLLHLDNVFYTERDYAAKCAKGGAL